MSILHDPIVNAPVESRKTYTTIIMQDPLLAAPVNGKEGVEEQSVVPPPRGPPTDDAEPEEKSDGGDRDRIAAPPPPATARNKRHGARNQHKMIGFVRWLTKTFALHPQQAVDGSTQPHRILDVAGGKGELAARLTLCQQCIVTMVDPRIADVPSVYMKTVVPKLPKKWQTRLQERLQDNPNFVEETVNARFRQLITYFTDETVEKDQELREAVETCTLLIGMHADSATECIVDVALRYNKPFVVVPCCVFPNLFKARVIVDSSSNQRIQVRSWEQFCDYLQLKDNKIRRHVLPFEGRNVAIYWDCK